MIHVRIKEKLAAKGTNMKECLKYVSKLFKDGHTEIYDHGGKIGSWRSE